MSSPFFEIDFNEKIEYVSISPFEWSQNLLCLAFKNKIVVGILKFQEDLEDMENEVEFEHVEEFYHGHRVHALSWNSNTSLHKIPKTIEICVASSDFSLRVFSTDISSRHHARKEIQGHSDYINDCAFDLEGDYLASVSDDLTCKLWSVNHSFQLLKTFTLTSPGMCLAWRHEDPGKLLVGEKKGIIRLYNVLTLQPLSCIMTSLVPLIGMSNCCQSKVIVILAGGELITTAVNLISHPTESKMVHPGGGFVVACCPGNDNYVATVGRPASTLKITNIKSKQSVLTASLESTSKGEFKLREKRTFDMTMLPLPSNDTALVKLKNEWVLGESRNYVKKMHKTSRKGFIHSVKVPRIYKASSVIVKKVVEEGGSLKDLVYSSGHKNIKGIYALVVETIKHSKELDKIIKISKLLQKESRLQPWLARILITELLYGKKELKGESKPVQTILSYKKQFEKLLFKETSNSQLTSNFTVKKPRYVRVNTLHYTPDEAIKIFRKEGWSFLPVPSEYSEFLKTISHLENDAFTRDFHIKELLIFPQSAQFYEHELYQNGSILLQDKASCLPAFLLKPKPDSTVLDMCAAPGMKTTHLSAIMKNRGKIYATEIDSRRFKVLCDLLRTSGCSNVTPMNIDALKLNKSQSNEDLSWGKDVEYILVDPSCSGSGMTDRVNIFSGEKNDPERLKKLCGFQFKLLIHALTNFPKVKRVVYSTCSVEPQENEKVVEDVLEKLNSFAEDEREKIKFRLAEPLKNSWPRRGSDDYEHGKYCIYSDPQNELTNGFFVAVFEKEENPRSFEFVTSENIKKQKKHERKLGNTPEETGDSNLEQETVKKKNKKRKTEK